MGNIINPDLHGIITPVITVFNDDESINEAGFGNVVEYLVGHGVDGIFVAGGQGEGASLDADERIRLLDICLETVQGRVPVLAGTGAVSTRAAAALTRRAAESGADAVTVLTPYYLSPDQNELYDHYRMILDSADIPVLIYNNPWRTHLTIRPETVARLCEYSGRMCGIKDSSGDLALTIAYKKACPSGFRVLIGRDQLIRAAFSAGLDGAVAATSNAAVEIVTGIWRACLAGDNCRAELLQDRLNPLREFFSQGTFPVVVKEAMMLRGLPAGPCRRPVGPLSSDARKCLGVILDEMGLM